MPNGAEQAKLVDVSSTEVGASDVLLGELLALQDEGRQTELDALLAAHPDHADELRQYLAGEVGIGAILGGRALQARARPRPQHDSLTKQAHKFPLLGDPANPSNTYAGYQLIRGIGYGAMGEVYLARQLALDRLVALKVIKDGRLVESDAMARFANESRLAARLTHPNIVRVHEAGEIEQHPYFSMDFVEGQNLQEHVLDKRLEPKQIATWMIQLAAAVEYAHQQNVLHRDLKPSNILIERSSLTPLVTDFGLAKCLQSEAQFTATGDAVGTLEYIAPEQLDTAGSATTATDIYGLGATLYFLLCGRAPHQGRFAAQTLAAVLTKEPLAPRKIDPTVPKDLETICLKCLERQPSRRYRTACEVAKELQRYLDGRPIQARPLGRLESACRWTNRHRTAALLLATLIVIAIAGPLAAIRMNTLRVQADDERDRAAQITDYLIRAFRSPDPELDGRKITIYEVLDRTLREFETSFEGDTQTKASLLLALGETLRELGVYQDAIRVLEQSLDLHVDWYGPSSPETLHAMSSVAEACFDAGQSKVAAERFERLLPLMRSELGESHPETLTALSGLGKSYFNAGQLDAAQNRLQDVFERRKLSLGENHSDTLNSMYNYAECLFYSNPTTATRMRKECLKRCRTYLGDRHPTTLAVMRVCSAIVPVEQVVELHRQVFGEDHRHTLQVLFNLAVSYKEEGHLDDAVRTLNQVAELRRQKLGVEDAGTLVAMRELAMLYDQTGRPEEARVLLKSTLDRMTRSLGEEHPESIGTLHFLGLLNMNDGNTDTGFQMLERSVELAKEHLGEAHMNTLGVINNLGLAYLKTDPKKAVALYERLASFAGDHPEFGSEHFVTLCAKSNLGLSYRDCGRTDEAIDVLKETLDCYRHLGQSDIDTRHVVYNLGLCYIDVEQYELAVPLLQEAINLSTTIRGSDHLDTISALHYLGDCYRRAGNVDEGLPLLQSTLKQVRQMKGDTDELSIEFAKNTLAAYLDAGMNEDWKRLATQFGLDATESRVAEE